MTARTRTSLALCAAALTVLANSPGTAHSASGTPARQQHGGDCAPRVSIGGYSDALNKARFHGRRVGGISALEQLPPSHRGTPPHRGSTAALSDRSVLYTLVPGHRPRVTGAVPLTDEHQRTLDSEALAVRPDGSLLVGSEREPAVRLYGPDGTQKGRLPVPGALRPAPAGRAQPNQTFEGLALQPDNGGGSVLTAAMEGELAGDGKDTRGRRLARMQNWDRHGAPTRQWAYPLDTQLGVSELAATGDGRMLVLERGFDKESGNTVRLYLADPRGAQDVAHQGRLTGRERPVRKTLLADLGHCPDLGASHPGKQTNPLLDNIEAMTVTGHAPGGRLRVLLASDDNESAQQVTRFYRLNVRLPGLR